DREGEGGLLDVEVVVGDARVAAVEAERYLVFAGDGAGLGGLIAGQLRLEGEFTLGVGRAVGGEARRGIDRRQLEGDVRQRQAVVQHPAARVHELGVRGA